MMHGGSKTIGGRNASGRENELEEYFAELADNEREPANGSASAESEHGSVQEELRRLTAYASHLKQNISELAKSSVYARQPTQRPSTSISVATGLATLLIAGVTISVTARLLAGRR